MVCYWVSESKGKYSHHDPIKFLTKSIESGFCDSSDSYILVTGNIAVKRRNTADTADIALGTIIQVALKNCAPFLLMEQVLLILEWLCIIWLNIVIIILILQEVYGPLKEMR